MVAETVLSVCDIHFGNLTEHQVTFINGRDIDLVLYRMVSR